MELKHQSVIRAGSPNSGVTDAESGVMNTEDGMAAGGILKTVHYRVSYPESAKAPREWMEEPKQESNVRATPKFS